MCVCHVLRLKQRKKRKLTNKSNDLSNAQCTQPFGASETTTTAKNIINWSTYFYAWNHMNIAWPINAFIHSIHKTARNKMEVISKMRYERRREKKMATELKTTRSQCTVLCIKIVFVAELEIFHFVFGLFLSETNSPFYFIYQDMIF